MAVAHQYKTGHSVSYLEIQRPGVQDMSPAPGKCHPGFLSPTLNTAPVGSDIRQRERKESPGQKSQPTADLA